MDRPLISVVITAYNYAHTVGTAIESALRQDYPNLEVVVMDNASTDGTPDVVRRFAGDPRLRYVRNAVNIGMTPNHNLGLRTARGEYVAFLSADDWLMPEFVSSSYRYLQDHPDVDVLYTTTYFADANERITGLRQMAGQPLAAYAGGRNELAALLKEGCYIAFPTMLVKREIYERFGDLDCNLKAGDHEIVVRWAAAGVRFGYEPRPSCVIRLHETQQSGMANYTANGRLLDEFLYLLEKYVTPGNEPRLAGSELGVQRHLTNLRDVTRHLGAPVDGALQARVDRALAKLSEIRRRNIERREPAFVTVAMLAGVDVALAEQTLRSLNEQTSDRFEVLVLHRPARPLDPLVRALDAHGRFRALQTVEPLSEAQAMNLALRLGRGNAFTFIREGSAFERDHIARLCAAFDERRAEVVLSPARLSVERRTTAAESTPLAVYDDAYPLPSLDALSIAPALPLESFAFRAHAADRAGLVDESLAALPWWEYFQRLRDGVAIDALAEPVTVRRFAGGGLPEMQLARAGQLSPVFETVYGKYPVGSALHEMRGAYLARINDALARGAAAATEPAGLLDACRVFSGFGVSAPPAARTA
ncbi:MAG TPA: glycosyltransferase [Candidatus Limnocylindrales bacterium]|nr:glycosyltransferase [Candidatus Limnocylindrales bacterium]